MNNREPLTIRPPGFERIESLIRRRESVDLSQAELSAAMGVHPSTVSRAERGRMPITEAFAERYRNALERCVAHLDAGDEHARRARAMDNEEGRTSRVVPLGDLFDDGGAA